MVMDYQSQVATWENAPDLPGVELARMEEASRWSCPGLDKPMLCLAENVVISSDP